MVRSVLKNMFISGLLYVFTTTKIGLNSEQFDCCSSLYLQTVVAIYPCFSKTMFPVCFYSHVSGCRSSSWEMSGGKPGMGYFKFSEKNWTPLFSWLFTTNGYLVIVK